jgi:hypothetical protein
MGSGCCRGVVVEIYHTSLAGLDIVYIKLNSS